MMYNASLKKRYLHHLRKNPLEKYLVKRRLRRGMTSVISDCFFEKRRVGKGSNFMDDRVFEFQRGALARAARQLRPPPFFLTPPFCGWGSLGISMAEPLFYGVVVLVTTLRPSP
ncbi:hypothetical protein NPIL_209991 [Nephila pilipes]|uniref:Uncharacterized protein n=1 Tax=Nephila pilipes TaxID=299642 RepID=A0A8X6IXQ1_NEPPI|nr:hypothetical protein NPIL_209991 [Nephila pilipes]